MAIDIFDRDMFTPMTEEEADKFENDLQPQNTATNANDVDIEYAVKLVSQDYDRLFE